MSGTLRPPNPDGLLAEDLPGAELLREGLTDLAAGRESEAALVLLIAAPRLRALGLDIPQHSERADLSDRESPEHRLYGLLLETSDPHSYYNALLARIASYARAAEHATPG